VAIKTIEKANVKPEEKALISEESIIMQKLNHPSIIKFIEQFEDSKKIYYVLELAEGNDLYSYILQHDRLSEDTCRQVMQRLFEVMHYLHQNQILHRDLKPENIMLSFNEDQSSLKSFKLIDFGFATYYSEDSLPSLSCGTLNYAAPEVLLGESYSTPSDVFSCGVILYLM
jgi:serine/threonine protein kinase